MENLEQEKTFTQAEVDEIVAKRLGREKGKQPADPEANDMTEQEQPEEEMMQDETQPEDQQPDGEEKIDEEAEQPMFQEEAEQPIPQEETPEGEEIPEEQEQGDQAGPDPLLARVATAELKAAMAVQGIDPQKLDRAVNLIKPEEFMTPEGEISNERMAELISELIQTWPELQRQQPRDQHIKFGVGQSSGGDTRNSAIAEIFGNR